MNESAKRQECMFFGLEKFCFLVKGAKRGAIYDMKSGDVYSVDERSVRMIGLLEQGASVENVAVSFSEREKEITDYLNKLEQLSLGKFLKIGEKISKIDLDPPKFILNFMWVEITRRCNLRCLHCYARSGMPQIYKGELEVKDWNRIIQEAFALGCRKIQLIGGEPLLFGRNLLSIIKLSRELGYEIIEVFSNATLFTDEYADFFARYGVQVAVSIYSKRPEIHDSITQANGSLKQTTAAIKKLKNKGVKVRFATIVLRQNEAYLPETLDFLAEMGELQIARCFDMVRPVGRGDNNCLVPERLKLWQYRRNPIFPKINTHTFIRRKYGHSCWSGSIAVTAGGDVIPCIMARKLKCGNVKKQPLKEIIEGVDLQRLWSLSKDKIQKCQDCEYRYLCVDCRPSIKKRLDSPDCFCTYDPYKGEWAR